MEILYKDEFFIAVHKPSGLFVHRSSFDPKADFIMRHVRNFVGSYVWPVHRLDRPTSGVVIFALSQEAAKLLSQKFSEKTIGKKYIAVVRGFTEGEGRIDYALQEEKTSPLKDAVTDYKRLRTVEFNNPVGRYKTSRFSLVEVMPETGRFHQIRKHFAHIFHPVLNDSVHGDGKQNRFIRDTFNINRLLLASTSLNFEHPFLEKSITIKAPVAFDMQQVIDKMFVGL